MVKSLGANAVIDYTKDDIMESGEFYDFILDALGEWKSSKLKLQSRNALTPKGKYILVDDGSPWATIENLVLLRKLVEAGQLKPVFDRCYSLDQMAEAHKCVDNGHKKGNVIITV
jgi:alcohol dehydrogenase